MLIDNDVILAASGCFVAPISDTSPAKSQTPTGSPFKCATLWRPKCDAAGAHQPIPPKMTLRRQKESDSKCTQNIIWLLLDAEMIVSIDCHQVADERQSWVLPPIHSTPLWSGGRNNQISLDDILILPPFFSRESVSRPQAGPYQHPGTNMQILDQ